jgi:DNA polymerase III epsilon subunit-like protein
MKYIAIDIETTGLDFHRNQILEIGMIADDLNTNETINNLPQFHCYVTHDIIRGDPYALHMNAEILRRISVKEEPFKYYGGKFVVERISAWLNAIGYKDEKPTFAGKNAAGFDLPFLDSTVDFRRIKRTHRTIDVGNLFVNLLDDVKLPDLTECLKRAGFDGPTAHHTAIGDCTDVVKLVRRKCNLERTRV